MKVCHGFHPVIVSYRFKFHRKGRKRIIDQKSLTQLVDFLKGTLTYFALKLLRCIDTIADCAVRTSSQGMKHRNRLP